MALEEAPTDQYGMPLLILPIHNGTIKYDDHHPWCPHEDERLQNESGKALRYSRIQRVPKWLHKRYGQLFSGPAIPEDEDHRFLLLELTEAGYLPEHVLDLRKAGECEITRLRPYLQREIFPGDEVRPDKAAVGRDGQHYKRRATGMFMARYALQQNLGHVDEWVIEEFLDEATNDERKIKLGKKLIGEAIRVAVDPIAPIHKEVKKRHMLPLGAPAHPFGVITQVFTEQYRKDYMRELTNNLLQQVA